MKNQLFSVFVFFSLIIGGCKNIEESVFIPIIAIGYEHTCALLDHNSVKCWGSNEGGQLGLGDTDNRGDEADQMGNNLLAVDLGTIGTVKTIASGGDHICALLNNNLIKCWGYNDDGQLGLGDTDDRGDEADEMGDNLPFVDLGIGRTAKAVVAGGYHTCAILDDRSVRCWGLNDYGQLGSGDTDRRGSKPNQMGGNLSVVDLGAGIGAKVIASGSDHLCAILGNNSVKCWGYNKFGQLGQEDNNNRGDEANEMGDNLSFVDLGTGRTAKAISTGSDHNCVLLDNDSVKCWGSNAFGQLGLGDTNHRGDEKNEVGDALLSVDLGVGRVARSVSAIGDHTCAVLDDGSLKCWGSNDFGQLGLGDTRYRGDGKNEMGDHLPVVDLGTEGVPIGIGSSGFSTYHTCVALDNGSIKCWGINDYGQLGLGDARSRGDEKSEMGDHLPAIEL